ncbi:sigma-70 family RNA polymerase sigma factor [Granulicoccus sp. GXG6511]|uniref:sigma-70 family RNA polymerase sigma factor n=1 Tax=Granulicoccus sp. GXG6511 TaxID=3381351 RepID=UPI003D7CD392
MAIVEPGRNEPSDGWDPVVLTGIVRRVVYARMGSHADADDVVQEVLARVFAARDRIQAETVEAYAVATARNLTASVWRDADRFRRHRHRLVDHDESAAPEDGLSRAEDRDAMARAMARLDAEDRSLLVSHEVDRVALLELADRAGVTPGAVAARLHRLRSRLRVEYLLALQRAEPPTPQCRTVLRALSSRDRRRMRESDAEHHLLECQFCSALRPSLQTEDPAIARIPVGADSDIVTARQAARQIAAAAEFPSVARTVLATLVSELARNIVRFGGLGEVVVDLVSQDERPGVRVVARDTGPGILDIDRAMTEGHSTYGGLGIGLPGVRRLSDEFDLVTKPGRGTTITCIIWKPGGKP